MWTRFLILWGLGFPHCWRLGQLILYVCQKDCPLDCSPAFILVLLHVSFSPTLYFDCMLWMTCSLALVDYFSLMFSRSTLDCLLSPAFPLYCLWLDNLLAPFDPRVDFDFLRSSLDSHVGLWHSWTSRCTLGYTWSSHLCSTTTEFGWTGLQRWSWKYWWSSDPHSISYEWDS